MNQVELFNRVSAEMSVLMTHRYSTSFSLGIRLFDKNFRNSICSIYGFVRLADEIVDTFHHVHQETYLKQIKKEVQSAIETGFSINTVLHAFADVVKKYNIEWEHIESFLKSMEMDLYKKTFTLEEYKNYIYGSAEVVGLFCLRVFCNADSKKYNELELYAKALGSAFQKINFLRDIQSDYKERGRVYFPNLDLNHFTQEQKLEIEKDIEFDFSQGKLGIKKLPDSCRSGVDLAYQYYYCLFQKIKKTNPDDLLKKRVRIGNFKKFVLLLRQLLRI